jgi:uncharacterized membrane protein
MMDKATYLAELEQELSSLAATDRQNALAYYHEFLEDAEAEGQTDAKAILGKPRTLAAQIKADIAISSLEGIETDAVSTFMEGIKSPSPSSVSETAPVTTPPASAPPTNASFTSAPSAAASTQETPTNPPAPSGPPAWAAAAATAPRIPLGGSNAAPVTAGGMPGGMPPQQQPPRKSGIGVVWAVVLAILAIPIGLPLAITVVALIFAVLVTLGALLFALAVTVVALLAAGVLSTIAGFIFLFTNFAVGLFYLGIGLVVLGVCILAGMGCWYLGKFCVKGVAKLFNTIRKRLTKKERGTQ